MMPPRVSLFLSLCVATSCVGQEFDRTSFDFGLDANVSDDKNVVHTLGVVTVGCPRGFLMIDHQCVHSGTPLRVQPRRPSKFIFLGGKLQPVEDPTVTSSAGDTSTTTANISALETTTSTKSQATTPAGKPPMKMTTMTLSRPVAPKEDPVEEPEADEGIVQGTTGGMATDGMAGGMADEMVIGSADGMAKRMVGGTGGGMVDAMTGEKIEVPIAISSAGDASTTTASITSETTTSTKSQATTKPAGAPPMKMTTMTLSQRVNHEEDPVEEPEADGGMVQGTTGGMTDEGMAEGSADGMARGTVEEIGGGMVDGMTDGTGEEIGEGTDVGTAGGTAGGTSSGLIHVLFAMGWVSFWI